MKSLPRSLQERKSKTLPVWWVFSTFTWTANREDAEV